MKTKDPFEGEFYLKSKMDAYDEEIPDFPMRKNKFSSIIGFLASPTKNPMDHFISESQGIIMLKAVPALIGICLAFVQTLIYFL
ncbi:hypothetical protein JOC85_001742 [Bacillus mesophilus]|uniref:Uncharacterized protein n=1 Tax=Bacillus mesophilus TaxID=1808955 RepID=A0A6M0Q8Z7_9BACI|nr:hypothetical protein [Bacillus mesophilus]MBM7660970.1 hypothetical protein [Bacillus mesophilus]NEY71488.1 hypothetical protein [Bacillus mesophilus]